MNLALLTVGAVQANSTEDVSGAALGVAEEGAGARSVLSRGVLSRGVLSRRLRGGSLGWLATTAAVGKGDSDTSEEKSDKLELHVD